MVLVGLVLRLLASIIPFMISAEVPNIQILEQTDDADVCETPACYDAANRILDNMNNSINPCDDFYSFACGGFVKNTHIPDDKKKIEYMDIMQDAINRKLRYALEEPIQENEFEFIKGLKIYYKSCMDEGVESRNNGSAHYSSRPEECVSQLMPYLPTHIFYVRKYFDRDIQKYIMDMINDLKNHYIKLVNAANWLDAGQKAIATEKIATLSSFICCPDSFWNDTILAENFPQEFRENEYEENVERLKNYEYSRYQLFDDITYGTPWTTHIHVADTTSSPQYMSTYKNSFHWEIKNTMILPAAYLQNPWFNFTYPSYMNYAGMGFAISHEMGHLFDSSDLLYKYRSNDTGGSPGSLDEFRLKFKCFIEQYFNFTTDGTRYKLRGYYNRNENAADAVGFKLAYLAYDAWSKQHKKEKKLPGLKYNVKQMFWISAANAWCTKYRPEFFQIEWWLNRHSPNPFRVIGSFQNQPEFATDFECPLGSKMNPETKCSIW